MWILLLLQISLAVAQFLGSHTRVTVDCNNIVDFPSSAKHTIFLCNDSDSMIVHSYRLKHQQDKEDPEWLHQQDREDSEWLHLKMGKLLKHTVSNKPMSSCLSTLRGGPASKSVTYSKGFSASAAGDLKLSYTNSKSYNLNLAPSYSVGARLETQIEYKCDTVANQTLQIHSSTTTYKLVGWECRTVRECDGVVDFGEWKALSNETVIGEFHEVTCRSQNATEPEFRKPSSTRPDSCYSVTY